MPVFADSNSGSLLITEDVGGVASWSVGLKNIVPGSRVIVRAQTSRSIDTNSYKTLDESGSPEILFGQKRSVILISRGSQISSRDLEELNPSFVYGFLTGDSFGSLQYGADKSVVSSLLFDRESRTLGVSAYTSAGAASSAAQFLSTGKPVLMRSDSAAVETQLDTSLRPFVRIVDRISRRPFVQARLSNDLDVRFEVCTSVDDIKNCRVSNNEKNQRYFSVYIPSNRADLSLTSSSTKDALTLQRDGSTIAQIYNNLRLELAP